MAGEVFGHYAIALPNKKGAGAVSAPAPKCIRR